MAEKKNSKYTCRLCGKEYDTISECIKCEYSCMRKEEAEVERQNKIKAQEQRNQEIKDLKEQIRMMRENEQSLHNEYLSMISKRRGLENKLYIIEHKTTPVKIELDDYVSNLIEDLFR